MPPTVEHRPPDRRRFLRAAATGAALSLSAKSYAATPGSNDRLRVAFLGCGGRAQAHIHLVNKLDAEARAVAVCDVWDGLEDDYDQPSNGRVIRRKYSQGLYPSAKKCGLDPTDKARVAKDYRRVLDLKYVDAVCVSTPDHWHARMTLDAAAAGKDVLCEKPLTRTPAEALAVLDALAKHNRVATVGVQSLADPVWRTAHDLIKSGRIGPVAHLSAGVFRHDVRGQWRFYRLVQEMTAKAIDWDLWLGHRFEVNGEPLGPKLPFDRTVFAQWRCYSPFSGGPFTDLFVHPVTRLLAAAGLRFPARVTGAGGLYQEHDGRDVPDVGTVAADFDEGCQLLVTGSTLSAYPQDEIIRGPGGALKFVKGGVQVIADGPGELVAVEPPKNETEALWRNFLDCVRRRDRATASPPELGAAAVAVVALARQSYRDGRAYFWDHERRQAVPADATWAARWEQRSRTRAAKHLNLEGPAGGEA
ncbi:MAG TPA: Gfo/Idh/MocA family oxidoreductase [Fimbriiglobus sp.]|nr:Gfo/Idh/MocA family oxidoreductase [Fimbriiglobus sp.]